ncbi:hypothetical protein L6452_08356 [Arctium lappa]|uniref:Uncharacterized protein n=1 Tax=Arctium lappa TaxID=4217 RepID=A0ACB9DH09_ARCLA|nr:hypothetical protein L6452_08356 [Arctium lappa]
MIFCNFLLTTKSITLLIRLPNGDSSQVTQISWHPRFSTQTTQLRKRIAWLRTVVVVGRPWLGGDHEGYNGDYP